jgi:hypothetical protein
MLAARAARSLDCSELAETFVLEARFAHERAMTAIQVCKEKPEFERKACAVGSSEPG